MRLDVNGCSHCYPIRIDSVALGAMTFWGLFFSCGSRFSCMPGRQLLISWTRVLRRRAPRQQLLAGNCWGHDCGLAPGFLGWVNLPFFFAPPPLATAGCQHSCRSCGENGGVTHFNTSYGPRRSETNLAHASKAPTAPIPAQPIPGQQAHSRQARRLPAVQYCSCITMLLPARQENRREKSQTVGRSGLLAVSGMK